MTTEKKELLSEYYISVMLVEYLNSVSVLLKRFIERIFQQSNTYKNWITTNEQQTHSHIIRFEIDSLFSFFFLLRIFFSCCLFNTTKILKSLIYPEDIFSNKYIIVLRISLWKKRCIWKKENISVQLFFPLYYSITFQIFFSVVVQ